MAFSLKNLGQRLLDSTTLDEKIGGAFKTATNTGRQWGQELKQGFIPAVKQTAPTVAQDFGNMFRNTFKSVPVLKTAGNIVGDFGQRVGSSVVDVAQGAYRTAQRPDLLGKAQGVAQTIRGVGKGLVSTMPATPFIDIAANIGKPDSLSRRLATGYSRGISQIPELAPNTQAKNVNIGKISFDPAMTAASMVGFVKNPINKKLFETTNLLIPSADKSLKLWLATTASRGGLENILLALPDMPEQMTTAQKAKWMATNAGIGAAQEIAGQGIIKGLGKVGSAVLESKPGKMTTEVLAKQFDNLLDFKRKWDIPYKKMGTGRLAGQEITAPMWKWKLGLVNDGSMRTLSSDIPTPKLSVEPTNKNLIAQHNIKPQGVLHADKMGGLPLPSIAISRKEYPLENFGDISLLAGRELYDPKIRSNKVYNADAYSPRYPSVNYTADSKAAEQNLSPIIEQTRKYFGNNPAVIPRYLDNYGSPVRALLEGGDFERKGSELLENSDLIKGYFAMNKGVKPDADYKVIDSIVEQNRGEFTKFVQDLTNSFAGKEQLFKGFTNAGNRRYIPHTLDNVVKEMKSAMGEGEGFNYGLGTIRSKVAKKYTKLSDIQADRNKIMPEAEFQKVRDSLDKEWDQILEDGVSHSSRDEFGEYDRFSSALVDGIKRGDIKAELEAYGFKGVNTARIEKFLDKVREAPTEYFEVKPQRAVDLSEFKVGVIPDDTDKGVIDILKSKGIKIYTYAKGERSKAIRNAADQNNMAFGMVAGFEPEYDEDGNLVGMKYDTAKGLAGMAVMAGVRSKAGQKFLGDINPKLASAPSPLGGKVGEAPTIKGIISQRPTGQVATQTPSELSLRQPSLPSQPNRPFLQTTQPQQPPQTPKLQMGSQKMPSTPEAQLDQWKYSSLDRLYTEGIDRFNPLSKVAKLAGRDKDMARQLARYYGTGSIADYHLTEELSPILKSVDINDLKKSAIAMRDVELASRGVKGSPEQVKAQANLQDLTNKLGQEKMTQLGESLKKLYAYQDSMVKKYLVDTGIMSQDSYNAMRKNNQFYVPFKRVMDDVDEMLGVPVKRGAGSVGKQNVIFGIKGSDKEIVDPIESIVENTYKLVSLGERQKTAKVIASLGEQLPGLIKKVATGDSKNTVGLFENGKKVFYEVPVEVADAARGMSEESLNTLIKILKLPTDVFRTMTTGANPEFLLPNVSRDLQTAWFNAGVNPIEWIAGIAHYVKGDQVYKDFLRSGGRTSIISANKEAITRTAQDLATNKGFSIKSPKDLWKGFEILGQFSEQPTRIASFKKIYDKAIKSGLSPEEALQDAAIAAQDTTINFARRGSKTQSINAVYAYLNARMQGVDKMLRTIKNEPGKAAARFGIGLLAPSLALYAWNNRFQSYYDPSVVSDRDKTDNFIFMLSDKRGGMQYLKIPKAEVGKIVNPVEEFLDFARGKDANMANSIKSLLTSFLPIDYIGGLVPTAIQPPLENAINKDLYTGYDLVPQYKKNYPKGYQDSPYTSPVYRMIGQKTGQSPAKLQNLVEGYLGGMSKGAEMITRPLIPQKYVSPKNEQGADINKTFILRRFAGGEKKSAADQAKANQAKNESLQTQINTITKQKLLGNFDSDVADKEIAKLEKQMATDKSIETKTNSNYYQFINNSGDLETIDIRQPIAEPKLTGQTEIDKKLKSSYKGKITSRINDIVKLVDAGQLDAKKAESMIKELQVKSAKMSGGKKPKVINIKTPKRKAIKFKLSSSRPTLKLTAPKTNKSRLSLRNYKVGKIKV